MFARKIQIQKCLETSQFWIIKVASLKFRIVTAWGLIFIFGHLLVKISKNVNLFEILWKNVNGSVSPIRLSNSSDKGITKSWVLFLGKMELRVKW